MKFFLVFCLVVSISALEKRNVKIQNFKRVYQPAQKDLYDIHVVIPVKEDLVKLRLKRNTDLNPNMKIEFENRELAKGYLDGVYPYQDTSTGAAVMVSEKIINGKVKRAIDGKFEHNGLQIYIKPSNDGEGDEHTIDIPALSERSFYDELFNFNLFEEKLNDAASKPHYHVQVVNIIDYTVWDYFLRLTFTKDEDETAQAIRYQFIHLMNGVDLVYRRINDPRYLISIYVKKFMIFKKKASCPFTDGPPPLNQPNNGNREAIDAGESLKQISNWIDNPNNTNGADYMDWDHTFVWTRKDLYSTGSYSTIGMAYLAGVCSRKGVSVNEYIGMRSWDTAAHELGHNLGSYHDGLGTSTACAASLQNVMTPISSSYVLSQIKNAFVFSQCSIDAIYNTIIGNTPNGYPRVCLMNRVCGNDAFNKNEITGDNKYPGLVYSLTEQCILKYGNEAKAETYGCSSFRVNDCQRLTCQVGNRCFFQEPGAADGSPCGNGKRCIKGRCVHPSKFDLYVNKDNRQSCTSGKALIRTIPPGCSDYNINYRVRYSDGVKTITKCRVAIGTFPEDCFGSLKQYCCRECHRLGLTDANNQVTNSISLCDPNPCKNNGVCRHYSSLSYVCECPVGYGGKTCSVNVN